MSLHLDSKDFTGILQASEASHDVDRTMVDDAQRYEKLYLTTPAMLHSIDSDGRIVSVSDHWLNVLGYRRDEVIGRHSIDFLTAESRRYALEEVLPAFRKLGYCRNISYDMVRQDGMTINVLLSATSETDANGRFVRSVAAIVDITEQRRAEEALRQSERRYRAVAMASSDWIWETDADLRLTYLSDQFFEITGRSPKESIGQSIDQLLASPTERGTAQSLREALTDREAFRAIMVELMSPQGQWLIFGMNGQPLIDDQGHFCGYCGTGNDITERIRTKQQQAEQAQIQAVLDRERERNASQRQFVAMVSHEFRTPLALIDGAAVQLERLQEQPIEGLSEKRIATIRGAVVRLTNLIERTLSASRIEEGKVRCVFDDCDIKDLLKSAAERQMAICRHHVRLDLRALPSCIKADAKLLDQVFANLLGNAVKYSPDAAEILVRAWADQKHVTIEVEDQGVGIPASEQPQVFQRFFRASTSTGIVGTGLGLHLCKHFVEMHGGCFDLRSVEGQGTTISVHLPIASRAAAIPFQNTR